jgi:hypothetical protein
MLMLEARIGETGIGIYGTPPCVHCGLPTQALLFSHSGGGLQHQHLVRRDREAPNLILRGLHRVVRLGVRTHLYSFEAVAPRELNRLLLAPVTIPRRVASGNLTTSCLGLSLVPAMTALLL